MMIFEIPIEPFICKLFGHKRRGDNFNGHYCARCGLEFDWGILDSYRTAEFADTVEIPKIAEMKSDDI